MTGMYTWSITLIIGLNGHSVLGMSLLEGNTHQIKNVHQHKC